MSNAPDASGSPVVDNFWDSQIQNPESGTPSSGTPGTDPQGSTPVTTVQSPTGDTGANGNANPQNPGTTTPPASPDQTVVRLNGQIAALQRQIQQMQRSTKQPANPTNAPNGQPGGETPSTYTPEQFSFALNAVEGQVRRGLEARISLYDGSNPAYKDQGNLSPEEVMLVRSNPLAFCTMDTVLSGDPEAVLDEIETNISRIASTKAAHGTPGATPASQPAGQTPPGMTVNPSPASTPDNSNNPQGGNADYWNMPIEDLKKIVAQNRVQPTR